MLGFIPIILLAGLVVHTPVPSPSARPLNIPAAVHGVLPGQMVELNPQPLPPKEILGSLDPSSQVELNPQPLPPKIGVLVDRGNMQFSARSFGAAENSYQEAQRLDPASAVVAYNLGIAEFRLGNRTAALAALQRAQTLAKAHGDAAVAARIHSTLTAILSNSIRTP
ncbi:MAG: tetratricopeptide repeat protein [Candidatus Eremiobacteraeota bacterium]|nr:tetratricopeptide repeat protein [Candidatus Eremiobacteraeota bacterium]